jgi:capsular exopolysaccharide synthesis family protein
MDNNNTNYFEEDSIGNDKINILDIITKYLRNWKWFVLSIFLSTIFAFYTLNFTRPEYRTESTIKIKDENGGDNSTLSVFKDLGMMGGSNDNIEDEIEILRSKGLIAEVVKSLKLNIQFFTDKNYISSFMDDNLGFDTHFYETERYLTEPLNINFFISDSILDKITNEFIISVKSSTRFKYIDIEHSIEKEHAFGEKISTSFGEIIITPNIDLKENNLIQSDILVSISAINDIARSYVNKIDIQAKSEYSSILSLTIRDGVKQKGEDILNTLVSKYNNRAISIKEELSKSTSDFVNQRLEIISNELSDVDLTAETIKTRYRLSDVASNTGLNMQSGQEIEKQIVEASTKLQQIESIKDFVSTKDVNDFIPVNVGVSDDNISISTQQYNQLMMEKKRLLENSTEKNPIVVNISEQLISLKNNIDQGLNNLENSQRISIDALTKQDIRINSRLYSAPKQERQIRDIQRQQGIKEALYLYLLQKREETAITLGVAEPNATIIDAAESSFGTISPKKKMFYLAAIFIGGLIPIVIIFLIDFLDTKVKSREEIEKILNIPVLGDIPKVEGKKRFLIAKSDHSSVAEAFRILRTNLSFLLTHSGEKGKIIFVTSTIAHEGKSFISSNLAASLGYAGKKTLILGMDIRAPKIKQHLGIRGSRGVTNYIIDTKLSIKDITVKVPKVENLDLISSGDIAPNPAELLMNPRVAELFDEVRNDYDYVIVDTAASSIITDTTLLRSYADAFIYVIRANYLDKRQLGYVKSVYRDKIFSNMALLINGVDTKKGYGYGYGYGLDHEKTIKKWWQLSKS